MTHIMEQYNRMGKNFMTPDIKWVELVGKDRLIELATGVGMNGKKIWGVSEFMLEHNKLETTKNGGCFHNEKEAKKHYTLLKLK